MCLCVCVCACVSVYTYTYTHTQPIRHRQLVTPGHIYNVIQLGTSQSVMVIHIYIYVYIYIYIYICVCVCVCRWVFNWFPIKPVCDTWSFYSGMPRPNQDMRSYFKKLLLSLAFPIKGCHRRQAINSALQIRGMETWDLQTHSINPPLPEWRCVCVYCRIFSFHA